MYNSDKFICDTTIHVHHPELCTLKHRSSRTNTSMWQSSSVDMTKCAQNEPSWYTGQGGGGSMTTAPLTFQILFTSLLSTKSSQNGFTYNNNSQEIRCWLILLEILFKLLHMVFQEDNTWAVNLPFNQWIHIWKGNQFDAYIEICAYLYNYTDHGMWWQLPQVRRMWL